MSDVAYQPLTGDPDLLRSKAQHYANIADSITRSVQTLDKVSEVDSMKSLATAKVREKAEEVAKDIKKARDRYAVTAQALIEYSAALRSAQSDARTAAVQVASAHENATRAHHAESTATDTATQSKASGAPTANSDATAATAATAAAQQADHALAQAQAEWNVALAAKNAAAERAISTINDVITGKNDHGLTDGFWDHVGAIAKIAYDVFKTICEWAAILSIFLAWVPGLGEVLLALAAIGAILTLVESIVNAINHDGSWGDVLFAAVGAVLTIFGGKLIEVAAKGLKGVMVVRETDQIAKLGLTGTAAERELAAVEGVGRHSAEFMNATEGATAARALNDMKTFSGFARQVGKATVESLHPEALTTTAQVAARQALIDAFTKVDAVNPDLMSVAKMALHNPTLVDGKVAAAAVTITAVQGGKVAVDVIGDVHDGRVPLLPAGFGALQDVARMVEDSAGKAK